MRPPVPPTARRTLWALAILAALVACASSPAHAVADDGAEERETTSTRASRDRSSRVRYAHRFGWDLARIEAPFGLGMAARVHPTPGIGFDLGGSTAGVSFAGHAAMSFYPIAWWTRSGVSPFVRGAYHYLHFNEHADRLLDAVGGEMRDSLASQGDALRLAGMGLHGASALVGLSVVGRHRGIFEISVGRYYQLGPSRGRTDVDGVVLRGVRLPVVAISFGAMFKRRRA